MIGSIFDLRGPEFLFLYIFLLAVASLAALALRSALSTPGGDVVAPPPLPPLDAAFLAGGRDQAVDAAVAALVQRKLVDVEPTSRTLKVARPAPAELDALERCVHDEIGPSATIHSVRRATGWRFDTLRPRLEQLGLMLRDQDSWRPRVVPTLAVGAVMVIGAIKLMVGLSRDRPVGLLILLLALTGYEMFLLVTTAPRLTRRGDRTVELLRLRNSALKTTVLARPERIAPGDLALAVGLFGAEVLRIGPMAPLGQALAPRPAAAASSGDGGGGSDGGSCGGSGCGGGGGCGGCGGCGG